jgi:hypothetical protein
MTYSDSEESYNSYDDDDNEDYFSSVDDEGDECSDGVDDDDGMDEDESCQSDGDDDDDMPQAAERNDKGYVFETEADVRKRQDEVTASVSELLSICGAWPPSSCGTAGGTPSGWRTSGSPTSGASTRPSAWRRTRVTPPRRSMTGRSPAPYASTSTPPAR